jgi:methylated-DNA-[protein]-cysteine S-methyltransferase
MHETIFQTDWGWIGLAATERGVAAVVLPQPTRHAVEHELLEAGVGHLSSGTAGEGAAASHLKAARTAIEAYLNGKGRVSARPLDLPLDLAGKTPFQVKVWKALQAIPYGRVRSYGWVARKVGKPRAARAVGAACGANPVPLLVPCHRVVAGDGSLGGFSGGLSNKKRLLKLEGNLLT